MSREIDASRLRAKLDAAQRAAFPAQRVFLHGLAAKVATQLRDVAPKDTNRYIASLLQGFQQAGVDGPSAPGLEPSRFRPVQRHQLTRQIQAIWQQLQSTKRGIRQLTQALAKCGYTSRGRPLDVQGHQWNSRLLTLKALEKAYTKLHASAIEQLARFESNPFAIVFGVGRGAIHRSGDARFGGAQNEVSNVLPAIEEVARARGGVGLRGVKLVVTVRQGVNGGTGVSAIAGGEPVIVVRSKEPHARILESKRGIVRKVLNEVRPAGMKQLKRDLVLEIAKASGLKTGAA